MSNERQENSVQPEVVCIGQALVDCITRGKESNPHKKNVYRAESIGLSTGGDALNESMVLAGMGHHVKLVCGVGNDVAGQLVLSTAKSHGVDISEAVQSDALTTPVANLMVETDGSRVSVNSRATMLEGFVPDTNVVRGAKVVSLASLFRAPLDQKETIIRLVKAAKEAGAIVCADTKMPTYREISLSDIAEILPYIDYMFPNENEAAYYTGKSDFMEMAQYLCEMGVKNVIVKTGEKGCTVCGQEESFQMPALDVEAVDSTGAGDNFVAGFISGLLHGWDLRKCCENGTACAAACVQHTGAVEKRK
jgi:sugar/nucleoside kinase (ribokinase family)